MFFVNLLTEKFSAKILPFCWKYKPGFYFFSLHKIKTSKQRRFILCILTLYRINVNHQQNVYIPLSSVPVMEQGIPWWLSKQISKLFFQMSFQAYSVPDKTEWKRKVFLEQTIIDLSSELSLKCGGNVNYYKSVRHTIPNCGNKEHPGNFQNKSVSSPFN